MAFEYVKDLGLKFNGNLQKRDKTDLILLHHTSGGSGETVQGIHNYHLSKGHKGIDYNIAVLQDGTVVWGRGLDKVGGSVNNSNASTKGMNARSVAIVALGDFEKHKMGDAQKNALKRVVRDVAQHYGIKTILGHNEAAGKNYTDCPGKYFPLAEVKEYALAKDVQQPPAAAPAKPEIAIPAYNESAVRTFVNRLYRHVLDRNADAGGLEYYINAIMNGELTPEQVLKAFFFSREELRNREPNEEFIREIYRGVLGREPDAKGFEYWLDGIYKDRSRYQILNAFMDGAEFAAVKKELMKK